MFYTRHALFRANIDTRPVGRPLDRKARHIIIRIHIFRCSRGQTDEPTSDNIFFFFFYIIASANKYVILLYDDPCRTRLHTPPDDGFRGFTIFNVIRPNNIIIYIIYHIISIIIPY